MTETSISLENLAHLIVVLSFACAIIVAVSKILCDAVYYIIDRIKARKKRRAEKQNP